MGLRDDRQGGFAGKPGLRYVVADIILLPRTPMGLLKDSPKILRALPPCPDAGADSSLTRWWASSRRGGMPCNRLADIRANRSHTGLMRLMPSPVMRTRRALK